MNSFDIAVYLGLIIATFAGFNTGLLRSALTIVAYVVAMPITVWVMSYVPPLEENYNSPLMQNSGFFLGAFLVIGMVLYGLDTALLFLNPAGNIIFIAVHGYFLYRLYKAYTEFAG